MKPFAAALLILIFCFGLFAGTGDDLVPVFQRAAAGAPLRAVFIGGSITQSGNGWITEWLEKTFPKSTVAVHNAGMSATGSGLGVFRMERDVMMHQPDAVFLEFAVNDGGQSDERTIRFLESMVVRLKTMKNPPAVVFIETAAKNKSNRSRHQRVAAHYGLLDIDLQTAIDVHLKKNRLPWEALMGDSVHPNKAGNEFYAKAIAEKLQPFAERGLRKPDCKAVAPRMKLPSPISEKPLLLDAGIQTLTPVKGWRKSHTMGAWWDMFMLGSVSSPKGGNVEMHIPFRGTVVGIMYGMNKKYGSFLASVDGAFPVEVPTNTRGGYSYRIFSDSLEPGEHILSIVVPEGENAVHLAYLMTAGDQGLKGNLSPKKKFSARLKTEYIPLEKLEWAGPYGTEYVCASGPTPALETVYPPERDEKNVQWKPLSGREHKVDFAKMTGFRNRGVSYLRTTIRSDSEKEVHLGVGLDYFGKLWLNGKLIREFRGGYGANQQMFFPVNLKKGDNRLLFKIHSGSAGNSAFLSVNTLKKKQ